MSLASYVNTRDIEFWVCEFIDTSFDTETTLDMLVAVSELAETEFAGLADKLDREEPYFTNGEITYPSGVKEALRAYIKMGLPSAVFSNDLGGIDMPIAVSMGFASQLMRWPPRFPPTYSSLLQRQISYPSSEPRP